MTVLRCRYARGLRTNAGAEVTYRRELPLGWRVGRPNAFQPRVVRLGAGFLAVGRAS